MRTISITIKSSKKAFLLSRVSNFHSISPNSNSPSPRTKTLILTRDDLSPRAEKMRELLQNLSGGTLATPPGPNMPPATGGGSSGFLWWLLDCHGLLFNLALIVPSTIFVAYLASQGRNSFAKLTYGRSYIMIAHYFLLWMVSFLNLLWCFLQAMQCNVAKQSSWNMLSLFTNSGMLFLEISLVAFLLQGNHATGSYALTRTFIISGIIVAGDMLLKAIYVFGFGVPLFIDDHQMIHRGKWGLWIVHELLLSAVYGFILFMHHSKWRERLPARPAFYNYICGMLLLNVVLLFSCVLIENGAGFGFGFWYCVYISFQKTFIKRNFVKNLLEMADSLYFYRLFDLAVVCYHALYLPFLYVTFLADFFQEEDMRLENVYYSEMKDAGFFDADWD